MQALHLLLQGLDRKAALLQFKLGFLAEAALVLKQQLQLRLLGFELGALASVPLVLRKEVVAHLGSLFESAPRARQFSLGALQLLRKFIHLQHPGVGSLGALEFLLLGVELPCQRPHLAFQDLPVPLQDFDILLVGGKGRGLGAGAFQRLPEAFQLLRRGGESLLEGLHLLCLGRNARKQLVLRQILEILAVRLLDFRDFLAAVFDSVCNQGDIPARILVLDILEDLQRLLVAM